MNCRIRSTLAFLVTFYLLVWPFQVSGVWGQGGRSRITGIVRMPDGSSATGFTVLAIGVSKGATSRVAGQVSSEGQFLISPLEPGDYAITAYKEGGSSDYPLSLFRFYKREPIYVSVKGGEQTPLILNLPRPLVRLTGIIRNAESGSGVAADVSMRLLNDDQADLRFRSDQTGRYKAAIPADERIKMEISSVGFTTKTLTFSCSEKTKCADALSVDVELLAEVHSK